jgi:methyl-accepting chemotaxis protein
MQHRRRILLINRKFQLKFTLFVFTWVLIISLALPLSLKTGLKQLLETLAPKIPIEALHQIEHFHDQIFAVYSVAALVAASILFWLCFLLSHRIAGPIYRIQIALERWTRGNIERNLKLRKHDHFKELADAYNGAAAEYSDFRNQVRVSCDQLELISRDLELKHRTQIQDIIGGMRCDNENKS